MPAGLTGASRTWRHPSRLVHDGATKLLNAFLKFLQLPTDPVVILVPAACSPNIYAELFVKITIPSLMSPLSIFLQHLSSNLYFPNLFAARFIHKNF